MTLDSSLLRAARRDAKRRQQEALMAYGLSSTGATVGPFHSFLVRRDYVPTGHAGGELQRTLVFWRDLNATSHYRVGVLNVPENIPASNSLDSYSVEELAPFHTRRTTGVFDIDACKYLGWQVQIF